MRVRRDPLLAQAQPRLLQSATSVNRTSDFRERGVQRMIVASRLERFALCSKRGFVGRVRRILTQPARFHSARTSLIDSTWVSVSNNGSVSAPLVNERNLAR